METPDRKIDLRDADDSAHAFRDSIELGMPEQTTHKRRHFVLSYGQVDQAIPAMTKTRSLKILIPRKKVGRRKRCNTVRISWSFIPWRPTS